MSLVQEIRKQKVEHIWLAIECTLASWLDVWSRFLLPKADFLVWQNAQIMPNWRKLCMSITVWHGKLIKKNWIQWSNYQDKHGHCAATGMNNWYINRYQVAIHLKLKKWITLMAIAMAVTIKLIIQMKVHLWQ